MATECKGLNGLNVNAIVSPSAVLDDIVQHCLQCPAHLDFVTGKAPETIMKQITGNIIVLST